MDLAKIAPNLQRGEEGIYYAKSASNISYPEGGNENYMQIEENSFWFMHRNNVLAESIKKYSEGKLFFDIGGGNGFVAKRLQEEGIEVVLLEPGKSGARNAQKRGIKHIICSSLEDAGFIPKSMEAVGLFDVLEHIKDDEVFLGEIYSYMKADSHIYINVPAYQFLWSEEDVEAGHFKRYTISGMKELLRKCGFEIIHASYIFSALPLPIFLLRSLPSRLGLAKKSGMLEKNKGEHELKSGVLNKTMQSIWNWEVNRVKKGRIIPFGSSCFVVGRKGANI